MSSPTLQTLCSIDERMFILLSYEKKLRVVELADGVVMNATPAPAGMWLSTAYVDTTGVRLVLATRQGKTYFVTPASGAKGRSVTIPTAGTGPHPKRGYVGDLKTIAGRPTLTGPGAQIYVWNGTGWDDEQDALLRAAPNRRIADVINVDDEPAVLLDRDRDHSQIFFRRDGAWHPGAVVGTAHAAAWRKSDKTLFAIGEGAWAITLGDEPTSRELAPLPMTMWAAAVFRDELFVSNLNCVFVLRGDRFEETLGLGESGAHNHSLSVHGDRLYLVRRDAIEVFDGQAWTTIPAKALV